MIGRICAWVFGFNLVFYGFAFYAEMIPGFSDLPSTETFRLWYTYVGLVAPAVCVFFGALLCSLATEATEEDV